MFPHEAMSCFSHLSFISVAQMSQSSPALSDYKIKVLLLFYDQIILNRISTSLIETSTFKVHPSLIIYGSSQRADLPVHTKESISKQQPPCKITALSLEYRPIICQTADKHFSYFLQQQHTIIHFKANKQHLESMHFHLVE